MLIYVYLDANEIHEKIAIGSARIKDRTYVTVNLTPHLVVYSESDPRPTLRAILEALDKHYCVYHPEPEQLDAQHLRQT